MAPVIRVLLVQDDTVAALAVEDSLLDAGHAVTVAFDAASALVFAASEAFDVAILGRGLPDMDAAILTERLRRVSPETRVMLGAAMERAGGIEPPTFSLGS